MAKLTSVQFDTIVAQSQVRFACSNEQAERLAKSVSSDLGKLPEMEASAKIGKFGKSGLSSISFKSDKADKDMLSDAGIRNTVALRLLRLLQILEMADKENIGLSNKSAVSLTLDLHDWLFQPAKSAPAANAPAAPESKGDTAPAASTAAPIVPAANAPAAKPAGKLVPAGK